MRSGGRVTPTVAVFGQLLLCLSFALLASSIPPSPWMAGGQFQIGLNFARKQSSENSGNSVIPMKDHDQYAHYFQQKVDHLGNVQGTFNQTFYVNREFASKAHVHILFLELKAALGFVTEVSVPHVANAKKLKATVWSLEHRFYGFSQPFGGDASVNSLKYLTVDQVIEDIADFIRAQNSASGETDAKWILYGGSYPGALALWFHQKYYSSLSFGVVSSSATYLTTVDNYQFQKNVEDTYAAYSEHCLSGISRALRRLRQMVQNERGRSAVSKTLKTSKNLNDLKLTDSELQLLNWVVALYLQIPVVFNGVRGNHGGQVADVCAVFKSSGKADYLKLVDAIGVVGKAFNFPASVDVGYDSFVNIFKRPGEDRNTLWQSCNELGSFITSDYGHLAVGSAFPNNFWLGICAAAFGPEYNIDNVKRGVNYTTNIYGSSNVYRAPNTIVTMGSVDPYRSLGVQEVTEPSSIIYTIDSSGSSADLNPTTDTDSSSLTSVRALITKKLKSWLSKGNNAEKLVKKVPSDAAKLSVPTRKIKNMNGKIEWNTPRPDEKELYENVKEKRRQRQSNGALKLDIVRTNTFPRRMERHYEKYLAGEAGDIESAPDGVNYGFIEQSLDHFDTSNKQTYKQLFINNNEFSEPSHELIFLMFGGEAPIDRGLLSNRLTMFEFAMDYNADMYALEHRYFGQSIPTDDLSVENLRWLTSEQALADAAVFISSVNAYKNYKHPKWVLFGGSYPGSLVAWHRLKYPELSVGGIASSAPVQAKTDFFEYLQVVNEATRKYGGASDCSKNIHAFFKWHQQKLNSAKGRKKISEIWRICPAWGVEPYKSDKDVELLLASIVFGVAGDVQYDNDGHDYVYKTCKMFEDMDAQVLGVSDEDNDEPAQLSQIKKVVEQLRPRIFPYAGENADAPPTIANTTSNEKPSAPPLRPHRQVQSKMAKTAKAFTEKDVLTGVVGLEKEEEHISESSSNTAEENEEQECNRFDYAQYVDDSRLDTPVDSSDRSWTYMTCKEFGFFQSSNIGPNAFESALPINFDVDFCTEIFGSSFTRSDIDANVRFTNDNYGGQYNYNGTNTVFVNGSEDPWHVLSVYPPYIRSGANVTSIFVDGTSHCADMYSFLTAQNPNIMQAKKTLKRIIRKWIKQ